MGNDGFDDDFYKIFKKYKLDFMDELNLREEVQSYTQKRFVSKDKIRAKIKELEKIRECFTNSTGMTEISTSIDTLQELLEEE